MKERIELRSRFLVLAVSIAMLALAGASPSFAANIITFGANANTCGGAVMCSSASGPLAAGTQGYLNNGTGVAFDLSTIDSWFQIDQNGVSYLTDQPVEPDMGAGGFLVVNNTGAPVTTFSLTLTDTFTSSTPSVGACPAPDSSEECDNFTAQGGSGNYTYDTELSGTDWVNCTQGTTSGMTCTDGPGGVAANFSQGSVTYTWTAAPGDAIGAGQEFDITFASWQGDNSAYVAPEPSSVTLLGIVLLALFGMGAFARRKLLA